MLSVYSDDHKLHHGRFEFAEGELLPCFERPERADLVLESLQSAALGEIIAPDEFGLKPLHRVHDSRYVEFLQQAWDLWTAEGRGSDALPFTFTMRGMRQVEPEHIDGKLSYFSFDAGTPIMAGTWRAVASAANVALTGAAKLIAGERCVFSVCRPPGHHAAVDYYGGYCFLNNAAIAAQYLLDNGAERVAILDVDYHHGNGTQSIFYDRNDVLFTSIHGHPDQEYPFFLGRADEHGSGLGEGCNANFPLRWQSSAEQWFDALNQALRLIAEYSPECVVISLGVDTFVGDPISQFRLEHDDFLTLGQHVAGLNLPMLYVLEGGYAIADIGKNAVNVLVGACEALR